MKIKFIILITSMLVMFLPIKMTYSAEKPPAIPTSLQNPKSQIDINTADAKTLTQSIKGIGGKRAEAIVKYREAHGKFASVKDLTEVPGLGKAFVSKHWDQLNAVFTVH